MPSDQQLSCQNKVPFFAYQVGSGNMYNASVAPPLGAALPPSTKHPMPFHGFQFQPSEVCPKNFIIYDQNDNRSRIMFHPALTQQFSFPGLDIHENFIQYNAGVSDMSGEIRKSSQKEDTDDIDALLSLEGGDQEDDDEEVSTARTLGSYGSSSPDSCSSHGTKPRKLRLSSSIKSFGSGNSGKSSCKSEEKRLRIKKMVKTLRGILPGGDRMPTAAVLDESVRYLKSLKVEANKLGVGNFNN